MVHKYTPISNWYTFHVLLLRVITFISGHAPSLNGMVPPIPDETQSTCLPFLYMPPHSFELHFAGEKRPMRSCMA